MSVILHTGSMSIRDGEGNRHTVDAISDMTTQQRISEINTAATNKKEEIIAEIVQKGAETNESIPDDYSALDERVSNIKKDLEDLKGQIDSVCVGLSDVEKNHLITILDAVIVDVSKQPQAFASLNVLKNMWGGSTNPDIPDTPIEPDVTLSHITATYTGDPVLVGTEASSITGITVNAYYSDGSSNSIIGWSITGTVADGENTFVISYEGKTCTVSITGYIEAEPEEPLTYRMETPTEFDGTLDIDTGVKLLNADRDWTIFFTATDYGATPNDVALFSLYKTNTDKLFYRYSSSWFTQTGNGTGGFDPVSRKPLKYVAVHNVGETNIKVLRTSKSLETISIQIPDGTNDATLHVGFNSQKNIKANGLIMSEFEILDRAMTTDEMSAYVNEVG